MEKIGVNIGKSVTWLVLSCMTRHERMSSERDSEDYWPGCTSKVRVKGHTTATGQAEDRGKTVVVLFFQFVCMPLSWYSGVHMPVT